MPAAKKYGVKGYPTILFVDGDGNVVVSTSGFRPPTDFIKLMNQVLDLKHIPDWEAKLKADPKDIDALTNLGTAAALKGDMAAAANYAKQGVDLHATAPGDVAKLADMYNSVGDSYQNAGKLEDAIPFFEDAATSGAETSKVAYALMSEIYCYFGLNKAQAALDAANRAAALTGLNKDDADHIAQLQAAAKKAVGGKG